MMDKKRQKDFFPITYKEESFLSSYVSPKEEQYQEFKKEEKLKTDQESKKKWRFKFSKQLQFLDLTEDNKGNFQFWIESSYRHVYYKKNEFEFDKDFSIIYQWNYPWYFSI